MRGAIVLLAGLALAAPATAAPLRVTLTASGDAGARDLGNGPPATVVHVGPAGRFVAGVVGHP